MTVKVTWEDGRMMFFGDSYKQWQEQFREYHNLHMAGIKPIQFEYSFTRWIGGGAKWRNQSLFLESLANENRRLDDFNFKAFEPTANVLHNLK
jgi:hypothetical protein